MNLDTKRLLEKTNKKIGALRKRPYLPESLIDLVAETAALQAETSAAFPFVLPENLDLTPLERVLAGAPMLDRERFPIDRDAAEDLFRKLLDLTAAPECELALSAQTVRQALEAKELDLSAAIRHYLAGDDAYFLAFGEKTPAAPRLLNFLVQASLAPSLEAAGQAVYAGYPRDRAWNFGHCPVCGSPPLIARLLEKEGQRHLTCSFCHVEYRAKRLSCPYCGEEDFGKLEYFTAEEEPGYQVHLCHTCKKYIKTVDFRQFDRISLPIFDDLESLALDLAAQNRGYCRPTLSAWGF